MLRAGTKVRPWPSIMSSALKDVSTTLIHDVEECYGEAISSFASGVTIVCNSVVCT